LAASRYCKRLIEVDLPIKRISAHARREKNIRQGHISSLHIWWARRPLAACRAVICAALWPDPADENCPPEFRRRAAEAVTKFAHQVLSSRELAEGCPETFPRWKAVAESSARLDPANPDHQNMLRHLLLDFLADFADWANATRSEYLEASRLLTQAAHESLGGPSGTQPLVLDPFAGGGAMPVEALRIGADAFAGDLNPIAALLNKVMLEYVPRYGESLAEEVRRWGYWVREQAIKELGPFYPEEPDGGTPIAYLWARTIRCEGPGCGVTVPIIKNQTLTARSGAEAAIAVEYHGRDLRTRVVTGAEARGIAGGTSRRSSVTCPSCGYTTPRKRVEVQANERGFGFHLLAVCVRYGDGRRIYRQPNTQDFRILEGSEAALAKWRGADFAGIPAIPEEELPYLMGIFTVRVYGIDQWYKLFHNRQLLSALVLTSIVRRCAEAVHQSHEDKQFASAVSECVALAASNGLQYQCNIATYLSEGIASAFIQGQCLPMKMDFVEANPLMTELAGGFEYSLKKHLSGLEYLASYSYGSGVAHQASALNELLPQDSVDLLATDPPYYDMIPYADCSDFFYVWLRRMLHRLANFNTSDDLTPKDQEIVQLAERNPRYRARTKEWFEHKMADALSIARESVKPDGVAVIVFAHKETSAWEALLQSVLSAGWIVTASWPIDTEKGTRLRANDSSVLGSSIHLVCRPREHPDGSVGADTVGDWRDVLQELPRRIHEWMPRLAREGVVGADAIFACLGPALEVFSRYSRVEKPSGEEVRLREYLEQVWAAVAKEALNMIFAGADATGFEEDARLTAMWLWTLSTGANGNGGGDEADEDDEDDEGSSKGGTTSGFTLEYDAARKIAQGLGAHLERLVSLVEVKGDKARLLPVAERTRHLFGKDDADAPTTGRAKKVKEAVLPFEEELVRVEQDAGRTGGGMGAPAPGATVLDRVHQAMLLFAAGRSEAMKRFLVEEGAGNDPRFWRLAQALSALYPAQTDEKRWVDGVLARKKGLGF